jgi:hypothetical protein
MVVLTRVLDVLFSLRGLEHSRKITSTYGRKQSFLYTTHKYFVLV